MHQCTILHIEDDEADHELFRRDLAKLGFAGQYVRARSFDEAKQFLDAGHVPDDKPDLIVADSKLGAYDGLDVIEWAKKNDRYRETPVVVYSTAIAPRRIKAGKAGATGVFRGSTWLGREGTTQTKGHKGKRRAAVVATEPQPCI